jgi:hypothetical protein
MWNRIKAFKCFLPSVNGWKRIFWASCMMGLLVLAFCWGRWYNLSGATQPQNSIPEGYSQDAVIDGPITLAHASLPVAMIHGTNVTRQELGEYLIARFGPERLKFFVNNRIIERACKERGIVVTDAEVEAQLIDDLQKMNIPSVEAFNSHILKRFGKTLHEFKEDNIRPKLALAKFCRDQVHVTEEDLQKAFEAKYGPKVQCRMIGVLKDEGRAAAEKIWTEVKQHPVLFEQYARKQSNQALAQIGGEIPPIHKHFGDERVEREAFSLAEGEVGSILDMKEGGYIILKCEKILARTLPENALQYKGEKEPESKSLRLTLYHEVFDQKLSQRIPEVFKALESEANPKYWLARKDEISSLAHRINPELQRNVPAVAQPASGVELKSAPPKYLDNAAGLGK